MKSYVVSAILEVIKAGAAGELWWTMAPHVRVGFLLGPDMVHLSSFARSSDANETYTTVLVIQITFRDLSQFEFIMVSFPSIRTQCEILDKR